MHPDHVIKRLSKSLYPKTYIYCFMREIFFSCILSHICDFVSVQDRDKNTENQKIILILALTFLTIHILYVFSRVFSPIYCPCGGLTMPGIPTLT